MILELNLNVSFFLVFSFLIVQSETFLYNLLKSTDTISITVDQIYTSCYHLSLIPCHLLFTITPEEIKKVLVF